MIEYCESKSSSTKHHSYNYQYNVRDYSTIKFGFMIEALKDGHIKRMYSMEAMSVVISNKENLYFSILNALSLMKRIDYTPLF